MESQNGNQFTVERHTAKGEDYITMESWTGNRYNSFDPEKARELGQALIDAADDVKRCRCGRTV